MLVTVSSDDFPKDDYPLMFKEVFFTIRILGCDIDSFYWTDPVTALTYEIGTGKKDFELETVYPTCGSLPIRYSVIDIDYTCCLSVTNSGKEIQVDTSDWSKIGTDFLTFEAFIDGPVDGSG